ncbi:MAG: SDR family oxidoreductase [Calditrichaceae bacterium]|nr:SDR family oxidoreductase [Calditrichaceae bacterium]MBN2708347.1 SDR family oxidoreductase [Calditrichaceae bacterium]RQV96584.1 MAG: SDR family oxidoreductase [Calditrichota bacterium]
MSYLETLFNIKGKRVVLTGGGGILAGEMAKGFVNAGAKVALLDINEESVFQKAKSLSRPGNEQLGLKCNVLDENNLKEIHQKILNQFGRIDVLVNAAGGNMSGATIGLNETVFDLKMENFKKVTDLNLNGTVLPTLIFGKTIADQNYGSIINISSMASYRAITRVIGYSAAKAAIDNFTRWMAVELASKFGNGIRINAIAPGFLLTEQNRTLLTNQDGSLTERGKTIINMTPFKRFGEPEELVGTALWLACDASRFVTGAVVPIDGGFSVSSGV